MAASSLPGGSSSAMKEAIAACIGAVSAVNHQWSSPGTTARRQTCVYGLAAALLLAGSASAAPASPLERCIGEIRSDLLGRPADSAISRIEHRVTRRQRQGAWEDFVIRTSAWDGAAESPGQAVRYHCRAHRFEPVVTLDSDR